MHFLLRFPLQYHFVQRTFQCVTQTYRSKKIGSKINTNQWETKHSKTYYMHSTWNRIQHVLYVCVPLVCILHSIWEFKISYANAKWLHVVLYFVSKQQQNKLWWTIFFFRCKKYVSKIRQLKKDERQDSQHQQKECLHFGIELLW